MLRRRRNGESPSGRSCAVVSLFFTAVGAQTCAPQETCSGPLGGSPLYGAVRYDAEYLQPPAYDLSIHPGRCSGGSTTPTKVEAQLYIYALNEVDQKKKEVTMSAYLRTWWKDSRLAFNATTDGGCFDDPMILTSQFNTRLWGPNLYIPNLVKAVFMKDLTYVYADGTIWRSEQVLLTTNCKLTFHRMPFDIHNCEVTLASYSFGASSMRIVAKGGTVGTASSGEGMIGKGITSVMWKMQDGPDFVVAGEVESAFGWDYLHLKYTLKRMPKFFILQYMVPDFMFLLLSYVGFYVNANIAPARAAVAVIPVLILRSLSNSVFSSIPQISTNVWLCDYLLVSMMLCCLCTVQFGIVQFALLKEKPGVERAAMLKSKKGVITKCLQEAKRFGVSVALLLKPEDRSDAIANMKKTEQKQKEKDKAAAAEKEAKKKENDTAEETTEAPAEADPVIKPKESKEGWLTCCAGESPSTQPVVCEVQVGVPTDVHPEMLGEQVESNLSEADLTLVVYACNLFNWYAGGQDFIGPRRMSKVLQRFNLFYDSRRTKKLMKLFLMDRDTKTTSDEDPTFQVDLMIDFLINVHDYLLALTPPGHLNPFSKNLPNSVKWDILFRWCFPIAVLGKMVIFFALASSYPVGDTFS
jgi:hypothetical protein